MTAEVFVDTNILLYAIDEDPAAAAKRSISISGPPRQAVDCLKQRRG